VSAYDCDQRLQAAAYLLGALEPDEAADYREHLDECASCRHELGELRPAASALPASAPPMRAPEPLIREVMERVRAEAELLNAAGPRADRVPRSRWWQARPVAALASTAALAAGAAAGIVLLATGSSTTQRVTQAVIAPSMPGAHALLRQTASRAELVIDGIAQPPAGKVYEVWLARAHQPPQATDALFTPARSGRASVAVPGDLAGVQRVMVTAEPAGGSAHPTSAPIIIATLKPA
jgi:anti-sigma-K factor RskA